MRRAGLMVAVLGSLGVLVGLSAASSVEAAGPFQFHSLTPCRVADTRQAPGPSGGPILADNATRNFPVQGICGVPVGAKAVTVNVTAVGPNGPGFLTIYPAGITRPVVSNLNFNAGEPALGNGAIVPLADQAQQPQDLAVFSRVAAGGAVHIVLDVTGYFQ